MNKDELINKDSMMETETNTEEYEELTDRWGQDFTAEKMSYGGERAREREAKRLCERETFFRFFPFLAATENIFMGLRPIHV